MRPLVSLDQGDRPDHPDSQASPATRDFAENQASQDHRVMLDQGDFPERLDLPGQRETRECREILVHPDPLDLPVRTDAWVCLA